MHESLVKKLLELSSGLTEAERANFKLVLGLAAGGLAPRFGRPSQSELTIAFDAVTNTLAQLHPYQDRIPADGVAFRGRPAFLTDVLLSSLQNEAKVMRPSAVPFDEHFLGRGAPLANRFAVSQELVDLVGAHAGPASATGVAIILYYDTAGQGIEPHIDTDIFSINALIMLQHQYAQESRSALVLFPPNRDPQRIYLEPGELIVLFAGSIAHGREPMQPGESVTILTIGFQPEAA